MKKKFTSLMMVLMMILNVVSVSATVSNPTDASYASEYNKIVCIEGEVPTTTESNITIYIQDSNGGIKYINQIKADDNRKYSLRFKYDGSLDDCTLSVREGAKDLNSSVTLSKATVELPTITLTLKDADGNWSINSNSRIQAAIDIQNKYMDKGYPFYVYIVGYDTEGRMVAVDRELKFLDVSELTATAERMPDTVKKVKAFAWTEELIPLSNVAQTSLDNYILECNKDEVVVAMVGDSLTHHVKSYKMALEHYYMTRYPDKTITFVNKGIGGNYASSLTGADGTGGRFEADIMDCEGKKPDIAIIMIGMNDNNFAYYDGINKNGNPTDDETGSALWNYNQFKVYYPLMIDRFLANDIKVITVSSSLLDESDNISTSNYKYTDKNGDVQGANSVGLKRIAEFQKQTAAEKGVAYMPMNEITTALDAQIRKANPGLELVFTRDDRVHPTYEGAAFVGYLFAENQVGNSNVANVEINAASNEVVKLDNATVSDLAASSTSVTYTYKAKSLPLAADTEYNYIEDTFGYDLTTKLNNEIIKVTGLEAGTYKVMLDGVLAGEYSETVLANGINIATLDANPNQVSSKAVWAAQKTKDTRSDEERTYYKNGDAEKQALKLASVQSNRQDARNKCVTKEYTVTISK